MGCHFLFQGNFPTLGLNLGLLHCRQTLYHLSHEVFIEPFNFSFFSITGWGIGLDYRDIEWFALETNSDHSVIFEIASKYCILDSFVDHDGYSNSSKGFLPTVVAIMVI